MINQLETNKKVLFENFISLGIMQIVSYILPLITLPYLSRILGVENFGRVFFAYAFIQYFAIITEFGFDLSAVRDVAINRDNKAKLDEIFNSVIFAKFILLIICYIFMALIVYFVPRLNEYAIIYHLSYLMVVGNVFFPFWFYQGIEHMKYITALNILSKAISVILIFICIKNSNDFIYYPLLNSLGFILGGIIGLYIAVKRFNIKLYIPKMKFVVNQFKQSSSYFLARCSFAILNNTNTFCLGMVSNPKSVGYYTASEKIYYALDSLNQPLHNALYPYMTKNKNKKLFKQAIIITSIVTFFIILFVIIFSKNIISTFYGNDMLPAYKILRIFAIVILFKIPATLIGFPLLGAFGYAKESNMTIAYTSIFHVIGLFLLFLVNKLNIYSIASLLAISYFIELTMRIYYIKKYKIYEKSDVDE